MKKTETFAKLAILFATIIWGTSFVIIKDVVDVIPPNYLMALRFTGACILLAVIFRKRLLGVTFKMLWQGGIIGFFLYLAYIFQTYGIMGTTPGKNAFLTAFYCVLVPFLAWISRGPKPDIWNIIAAIMCVGGIGLISLNGDFTVGIGDLLTLVGGFFFACHMVAVSKFGKDRDPIVITILQFVSASICFWITSFVTEEAPSGISSEAALPVIYLCLFCTALALLLQNFGQKYTTPSAASLLLSLEAVFGTLISTVLGREDLTFRTILGFSVIFIAIIISETKLSFFHRTK